MSKKQRAFSPQEKAQVALSAIKGEKTIVQISSDFQVHPTQVGIWKKQALDNFPELFKDNLKKERQKELSYQEQLDNLYRVIGQRDIELDWLKKKLSIFNP
jgi:transposase-like protein